jgi:IclR family mhp operon transcriptional activator
MLLSAPGRAYLAWCPEKERTSILTQLKKDPGMGLELLEQPQRIEEILEETRDRGYAIRDTAWGGDYSKSKNEYDDGLGAIAVPILSGRKVLGCVNLVWIARLFNSDQIARKHADRLKVAALKISSLA